MSIESPERVLQFMAEEYRSHLAQVKKLEHAIEQQQKMSIHKTIPKAYRPQVLTPINRNKSIVEDFDKNFEKLFFQHLERVQTSNSITLEVEKAHIANILSRVDDFLSKLKTTTDHIARLYDNFVHQNLIVREIPQQLAKLLPQDYVNPSTTINPNTPTPQDLDKQDTTTTINPSAPTLLTRQLHISNRKRKSRSEHPAGRKASKRGHFLSRGLPNNPQPP
jgi:hypothetical protein